MFLQTAPHRELRRRLPQRMRRTIICCAIQQAPTPVVVHPCAQLRPCTLTVSIYQVSKQPQQATRNMLPARAFRCSIWERCNVLHMKQNCVQGRYNRMRAFTDIARQHALRVAEHTSLTAPGGALGVGQRFSKEEGAGRTEHTATCTNQTICVFIS